MKEIFEICVLAAKNGGEFEVIPDSREYKYLEDCKAALGVLLYGEWLHGEGENKIYKIRARGPAGTRLFYKNYSVFNIPIIRPAVKEDIITIEEFINDYPQYKKFCEMACNNLKFYSEIKCGSMELGVIKVEGYWCVIEYSENVVSDYCIPFEEDKIYPLQQFKRVYEFKRYNYHGEQI